MTKFDLEAERAARAANPQLTPYDTGSMLQPVVYVAGGEYRKPSEDYGKVDFDDTEGATVATVFAHPSSVEDDTTVVQIDTTGGRFKVVLNEGVLFNGDVDVPERVPATSASERVSAARDAIGEWSKLDRAYSGDGRPWPRGDKLADALRGMVESAEIVKTPEALAHDVYMGIHSFPWPVDGDAMRDLLARGIRAGIQAAWESWEPADVVKTDDSRPVVTDADRAELAEAIAACRVAAEGDSNDGELAALGDALSLACGMLGVESVWA